MKTEIIPLSTKQDIKKFVKAQWLFYKNDQYFVPPIIADRMKLLDTEKNPFYKHSEIKLFLAVKNNKIAGRIAAITNGNHNKTHNDKVGFFGFFECINDQEVANALFGAAKKWLRDKKMEIMRGPMNPSQNDEIGLLIEGFDDPPQIMMTYNPKYYLELMEKAGLEKAKDLFAYKVEYEGAATPKIVRMQKIIRERYEVTVRQFNFKNKKQFKADLDQVKEIYNSAWEPNWGFVKMTDEEMDHMAGDLRMIAEPKLAFFVESKGKTVGFALGLPDINQALIYNKNGSMLGALWNLTTKKKKIKRLRIIILGILPDYQKTGVDAVLYDEFHTRAIELKLLYGEASWILEDNTMINRALTTTMHGVIYKKYRILEMEI